MAGQQIAKRRRPSIADDEIGEAWGNTTKDNDDEGIMVDDLYIQADETDIVPEKERTGCWHGCMRSIKGVWATRQMAANGETDREWYVKTTIKELVIYLVFLTILCILTFGMMSPNMYYLTKVISELFLESPYEDTRNNVKGSTQIIDFWRFDQYVLHDCLFWEKWYDNDGTPTLQEDRNVLYENRLLGSPRLRMLRVRNDSCVVHDDFKSSISECYDVYSPQVEDKRSFGVMNGTAWNYFSERELGGSSHWGLLATYSGAGSYADLGSHSDSSLNATVGMVRVGTNSAGHMFFEFKTVAKFYGCFVLDHHTLPGVKSSVSAPSNLDVQFELELLWSEQTFDGPIQFWRSTSKYNLMCSKDVAGFGIMFFIVFFAFAQLGYLLFGTVVRDFSTFAKAVFTLLRLILGDFNFYELEAANRILGPIYFLSYVFFVFFVLMNMFLAIINDTYAEVKAEIASQKNEFEIADYFKKGFNNMMGKLGKRNQLLDLQNALKLADSNGDNKLTFEEVRQKLRQQNFTDMEIEMLFAKYDINNDRELDADETKMMLADLDNQRLEIERQVHKPESNESSNAVNSVAMASLVSQQDFNGLSERVDKMENSIGNIVSKIDAVLNKMAAMDRAKVKRRENMNKILNTISESGDLDEKAKRHHMEKMVREELQRWDSESSLRVPNTSSIPSPKKKK
ncbi:Polycystic kidney disease 2-like 1 protein like [Argiope bruennichi]|uniref:Polycystic kidney disease 2-like 1 protein like n=1 Tax=Argiope bruennichi TaxID=94029 RepID=A0A8T0ED39_ARGBR|nr:Polycystic kidney disease 2-like 1 protein like [Argiope bruennichi]